MSEAIVTGTGSSAGEPAYDDARVLSGGSVSGGEEEVPERDEPTVDRPAATDAGEITDRLRKGVAEGLILPRDASIAAGRMGLKALPEGNSDAAALYGITSRQGRATTRRVSEIVQGQEGDIPVRADDTASSGASAPDPSALVGAEISLSPLPESSDGMRALEVLRWQEQGEPVRRSRPGEGSAPGSTRVRQHRYRYQLRTRMQSVASNPVRSVGSPYLVLPMTLGPDLVERVPQTQRRRGRPPDLDWLASQVSALNQAYADRDASFRDLASIVLWAFARYPASPDRSLEADGLCIAAAIYRELGSLGAYWLAQRVRYLVGDQDIRAIGSAHDSIIVLRNSGYWNQARLLLDEALSALRHSDISNSDKSWLHQLLLGLASLFFTGIHPVIDAEAARRYCRAGQAFPYGYESRRWLRGLRRAEFEIEYACARRRAMASRERFWLTPAAARCFDLAEQEMRDEDTPMYRAQWALMRMRLGIDRRDTAEIVSSAEDYLKLGSDHRWIIRDHPSERYQYTRYRLAVLQKNRWIERELPEISEAFPGVY
jgi:hypothetical protein